MVDRRARTSAAAPPTAQSDDASGEEALGLDDLTDYLTRRGVAGAAGRLQGWTAATRRRPCGTVEHIYTAPATSGAKGKKHRSRPQVLRALGVTSIRKQESPKKRKADAEETSRRVTPRKAPRGVEEAVAVKPVAKKQKPRVVFDVDLLEYGYLPPALPPSFADVERALRSIEVPVTMGRQNIHKDDEGVRSVSIGCVSARCHGVLASLFARQRPALTRLLVRFGLSLLPEGFKFSTIQLNHNFASELHVDDYNCGPSAIIGLGNYKGGELWTLQKGSLNCKRRMCRYDGREPHATMSFKGERYTLIFFTHSTHPLLDQQDRLYLQSLGFPLPERHEQIRFSPTSAEPPRRVKLSAGKAALDAHLAGASLAVARARSDRVFEDWRLEDFKEATAEQLALQGRVFTDDGLRWRVRDAQHRGVYFDLELHKICIEYYDFDAHGLNDPEEADFIEFTPHDELVGFAQWVDDVRQHDEGRQHRARESEARRLDAKNAAEAADEAFEVLKLLGLL